MDLLKRLGYPSDSRLLIVHADDLGMTHSTNTAAMKALATGLVNSASLMIPCPWFPEIAEYSLMRKEIDFGIHLTLTSEQYPSRWRPIASREQVPSLVDPHGYFHRDITVSTAVNPLEVEREIRAQVDLALSYGLRPTHLDSHQFRVFTSGRDVFEAYMRVSRDHRIPCLISRDLITKYQYMESALNDHDLILDGVISAGRATPPRKWADFYTNELSAMRPGIYQCVIHVAFDDEEMRGLCGNRPSWGAAWRQRDLDFFTSGKFRRLLKSQRINLVTWRELRQCMEY
jgi:chitin disaccharide deacetylase